MLQSQLGVVGSKGWNLCAQAKQEDFDEQIWQELDGTGRATAKVSHCDMTPLAYVALSSAR